MERNTQNITDRIAIIDAISRFGMYVDWQEWEPLRELMADEVWIDYSSLDGVEPGRVETRILISSWRELISGFESVQHVITNHCVDVQTRTSAVCRAHVRVHHVLPTRNGGSSWTLGGTYTFGLERVGRIWKITRITLQTLWSDGNQHLFTLAFKQAQETHV